MIASIWGQEGSGKSTVGLSWPKPLLHFDLDVGGFERAIWKVQELNPDLRIRQCGPKEDLKNIDWNEWDIVSKPYLLPIQLEKMIGAQSIQQPGQVKATIRFPRRVIGYKETWEELIIDFVTACQVPTLKSVVVDSATAQWVICHTAHLQDKQEIQIAQGIKETDPKFREKLQPVEFPNEKMRSFIYTARSFGKNLIMTHYPGDVYANKVTDRGVESYKTGAITPDGFKDTKKLVDIILWTYLESNEPRAKVDPICMKCGLPGMGMTAVGMELPDPSYAGLMKLRDFMVAGE